MKGVIDGNVIVLAKNHPVQSFFEEDDGIVYRARNKAYQAVRLRPEQDKIVATFEYDNRRSVEAYIPEDSASLRHERLKPGKLTDLPFANQYGIVTPKGARILCSPQTELTDPPTNYLSGKHFSAYKNAMNNRYYRRFLLAWRDKQEQMKGVAQEFVKEGYKRTIAQHLYHLAEWLLPNDWAETALRAGYAIDKNKDLFAMIEIANYIARKNNCRAEAWLREQMRFTKGKKRAVLLHRLATYARMRKDHDEEQSLLEQSTLFNSQSREERMKRCFSLN